MGLQIKTRSTSDTLTEVTWSIFRSWSGKRYVNGREFHGPVFYYLSHKRADKDDS